MAESDTADLAPAARAWVSARRTIGAWCAIAVDLARVRIALLVALSTAAGYSLFARRLDLEAVFPLLGVVLLACGGSALNQVQDARIDALMPRTRGRPIPTGRTDRLHATYLGGVFVLAGLSLLSSTEWHSRTLLALGILALAWYNLVYTYLKRVTLFAVVVGAAVGAIPPLIGWAAAGGKVADPAIRPLAFFLFLWQVPHFWVLWSARGAEYATAGLPSPTRTFSPEQRARITFVWIAATAAAGSLLALTPRLGIACRLVLVAASVWLVARNSPFPRSAESPQGARGDFTRLTRYAVLVLAALILGALASKG